MAAVTRHRKVGFSWIVSDVVDETEKLSMAL
jgi:hypothetical protein